MKSFKLITISDTHFGIGAGSPENPASGLNLRTEDAFSAFDQVIDFAIENKVKILVHSGDVFDTKYVSQNVVNAFYERVTRLSQNGIFFYCEAGNHDANLNLNRRNGLDIAKTLKVENTYFTRGNDILDLNYIQIVSLSYWNTPETAEQFLKEASSQVDWQRPVWLVGHLEIDYPGSIGAFKEALHTIPLSILTAYPFTGCQYGHIHQSIVLAENPYSFYTGSLIRCTFTEETFDKHFNVFTIENNKIQNIKKIPIDCLKMKTIKGTSEEVHEQLNSKYNFDNVIARIIVDETNGPLDIKLVKDKLANSFSYKIQKESRRVEHKQIDSTNLLGLKSYSNKYFEKHPRKKELLKMIENFELIDGAKQL